MTSQEPRVRRPLGLTPRRAGRIMIGVAYVGVVAAVVGAIVGWRFMGDLSRANERGLVLAEDSLLAAQASLEVADDVVAAVDGALSALGQTITTVGDSLDETTAVAGSSATLAGQLPDTLERLDAGLGSLAGIAGTIDGTLGQLSRIPLAPDYDPDVTFAEAIQDVRDDLAPLADDLRTFSDDLAGFAEGGDGLGTDLDALAASVDEVRTAVVTSTAVIEQARRSTDEALDLSTTTLNEIGSQLTWSRVLLVVIALVIAVGQIVPYWVGRELLTRRDDATIGDAVEGAPPPPARTPPTAE